MKSVRLGFEFYFRSCRRDFPGGSVVENLLDDVGNVGVSPDPGRPRMPWSN